MKKFFVLLSLMFIFVQPCLADVQYRIEVLQVSNIPLFERTYNGFVETIAKQGIVEGKNLTINRHIIDADADASIWERVGVLFKIKKAASNIVDAHPDLVLTISTPATKYSKNKFIQAGIPVVFSAVANPIVVGCKSLETPGEGFTGATLYMDPLAQLTLAKLAVPAIKAMGIVYSDDDNAVAFVQEMKRKAPQLGISIITKQVKKSEPFTPAANELLAKGIDSLGLPLDSFYGLRNDEAGRKLSKFARENKLPLFAFTNHPVSGAVLYIGPDFKYIGELSGQQAVMILKNGKNPGELPILRQKDLVVYTDPDAVKRLGIVFPESLSKVAKPANIIE